jgi:probable rRNA maturation factor
LQVVDVVNLQRKVKLDAGKFKRFADAITPTVTGTEKSRFAVAFVSDRRMKELNHFFRGRDSTTDVLSFPHEPDEFLSGPTATEGGSDFLGDIVISAEQAARQAKENKLTLDAEIKQLILHGLLHLCGYNHETDNGEMDARELDLRKELHI